MNIVILIVSILLSGTLYAGETKSGIDGYLDNNVYRNNFFKLTASVPDGWVAIDDKVRNKYLPQVNHSTVLLFSFSQKKIPGSNSFRTKLIGIAERINTEIKAGDDYLEKVKVLMGRSTPQYKTTSVRQNKIINGQKIYLLEVQREIAGITIVQRLYCILVKNRALTLMAVYSDKAQKEYLENRILRIFSSIQP